MLEIVKGIIRHGMTFGGGFLVESGLTDSAQWDTAIAAVVTLIGVGWSIYEKKKGK
jgi:hypothetical protein